MKKLEGTMGIIFIVCAHFYSFSSFLVVGTIRTSYVQGVIFGELLKDALSNFKSRIVIQV
jgi:hypothetical protein